VVREERSICADVTSLIPSLPHPPHPLRCTMGPMLHVVYGTAGHIDHGKTALVRALTGIDCDRLPEERDRGITIDLGFAHLEHEDLQLHFVDVPGHERLVHTMVAGAAGIDLALLVVAADEGIMPQTREHLAVIRLMGVPGGAVALTKIDLVDEELVELVAEEVADLLESTAFARAPVVGVSSRTGQGLDELRRVLVEQAKAAKPRQRTGRPFRQAVDRVFTMAGAGTIITGTSLWGELEAGTELMVFPGGLKTRARRLHVHGLERQRVEAGERVAINLAGLSTQQVERGAQVLTRGDWEPTRLATVRLELLRNAPHDLDEGDELEVHALASRVPARVDRLWPRPLTPGSEAVAQLSLAQPLLVFPDDHLVLRRPAPVNTFAGAVVLDARLPRLRRREAEELASLPHPRPDGWPDLLGSWIERAGLRAPTVEELASRLGVLADAVEAPLGRLLNTGSVRALLTQPPRLVAEGHLAALATAAAVELCTRLEGEIVSAGIPAQDFAAALLPRPARSLSAVYLEELRQRGVLELTAGRVVPPGSEEHMTDIGKELTRRLESLYHEAGLDPPSPAAAAEQLGAKPSTVEGICRYLLQRGRLARLEGRILIHRASLDSVTREIRQWGVPSFSVGEFKAKFQLTRKLAIPILEWLDSERVTLRQGSSRKVLPPKG
jgi:selenocysteine-specific elongation factor